MDFYSVQQKIVLDDCCELSYTEDDNEDLFKQDLQLAIKYECGFNDAQCEQIYAKAYQESHSSGYESILFDAKDLAYFCRKIMNLEA